jgi:hypothetical protein
MPLAVQHPIGKLHLPGVISHKVIGKAKAVAYKHDNEQHQSDNKKVSL